MDKITTPMAVLISGVLISFVLYLDYSKPEYHYSINEGYAPHVIHRTNIDTGQLCFRSYDPVVVEEVGWECYKAPKTKLIIR